MAYCTSNYHVLDGFRYSGLFNVVKRCNERFNYGSSGFGRRVGQRYLYCHFARRGNATFVCQKTPGRALPEDQLYPQSTELLQDSRVAP